MNVKACLSVVIPATRAVHFPPQGQEAIKPGPMAHINLLVSTPLGCDERMVDIVYNVTFPKGDHWCFSLRHIVSSHAATDIACVQIHFLQQTKHADKCPEHKTCYHVVLSMQDDAAFDHMTCSLMTAYSSRNLGVYWVLHISRTCRDS